MRELVEHGWTVTVLDRERPPHQPTPRGLQPAVPGVRYRIGNHENLGDLVEVFAGCEAAIHLAAIASPGTFPDTTVFTTNVVGNFNACEAAAVLGLKSLAMASSINTLGQGYRTHLHLPDFVPVKLVGPTGTVAATIVSDELPKMLPEVARTTDVPAVVGAVKSPVEVTVPPPLVTLQVKAC